MEAADPNPSAILQACAIPFRWRGGCLEFCLITSMKRRRWIFPKGIIDPGETLRQTAEKESFEEAGLHGRVWEQPLGQYRDFKWGSQLCVTVVIMEVIRCDDAWPEADLRDRQWVDAKQAVPLLSKESMQEFAQAAFDRITAEAGDGK